MNLDHRTTPARSDLADERLRGRVQADRFITGERQRIAVAYHSLHRKPSFDSAVDTQALFGEDVEIFDRRNGWAWVQLRADGYVGYLPENALEPVTREATHRVRTLRTFVYPGPSLKLPNRGLLTLNSRVVVARADGEYAELSTGGFVMRAHLANLSDFEADFASVAERFLHTPYLWGGKTSIGTDCSGLVQLALCAAGIEAPRDSDMQEQFLGTPVSLDPCVSGLQRGDLVFWKGHVAIMLDAERMIHATGHTMTVSVEPLAEAEARIRTVSYGPMTAIKRLPGNTL